MGEGIKKVALVSFAAVGVFVAAVTVMLFMAAASPEFIEYS